MPEAGAKDAKVGMVVVRRAYNVKSLFERLRRLHTAVSHLEAVVGDHQRVPE